MRFRPRCTILVLSQSRLDCFNKTNFPREKTIQEDASLLLGKAFVVTADPLVVRHMLRTDFDTFNKFEYDERKMYSKRNKKRLYCAAAQSHSHAERMRTGYAVHRADTMKEWLGAGIFTLRHGADEIERPQWYLQRKTASHIFKRHIFTKLMINVFLGKSDMSWSATSHAY